MAVKASAEVTVTDQTDAVALVTWHMATTSATAPSAPATTDASVTPSGWSVAEPTISSDADLAKYDYACLQTVWGDGTCTWGEVTLSAAFEAAKIAWNRASAAAGAVETIANPNLYPFFSIPLSDCTEVTTTSELDDIANNTSDYWCALNYGSLPHTLDHIEALPDGWAHIEYDNSEGSSLTGPAYLFARDIVGLEANHTYTVLFEFRDAVTTGDDPGWTLSSGSGQIGGVLKVEYSELSFVGGSAVAHKQVIPNRAGLSKWTLAWALGVKAGTSVSFDVRISFFDGAYTGPYKPYVDQSLRLRLDATQAELDASRDWYAACDTAADVAAKVATVTPATTALTTDTLTPGTVVRVRFSVTNSAAVANLTLDVNGTGAKPVKTLRNAGLANIAAVGYLAAGVVREFFYDGTNWVMDENYNADTYNRTKHDNVIKAAVAITSGRIICGTSSGYRNIAASVAFDLAYPLLYASSAIAVNATGNNNYLQLNSVKASNNGSIQGAAQYKTLYLKGTVVGNTFTIAASSFLTCTVPTADDGFCYMPLGMFYNSTTNIYFNSSSQLYAYRDGAFGPVSIREASAASKTATAYIMDTPTQSVDGIWITPSDRRADPQTNEPTADTRGWRIGDALELFRGTASMIKAWVESGVAKLRVGAEAAGHLVLSPTGVDVRSGSVGVVSLAASVANGWREAVIELSGNANNTALKLKDHVSTDDSKATLTAGFNASVEVHRSDSAIEYGPSDEFLGYDFVYADGDALGLNGATYDIDGQVVPAIAAHCSDGADVLSLDGAVEAYNSSNWLPKWRRCGRVVEVCGAVKPKSQVASGGTLSIGTLPTGCHPANQIDVVCRGGAHKTWLLTITTGGAITCSEYGGTSNEAIAAGTMLPFQATFVVS